MYTYVCMYVRMYDTHSTASVVAYRIENNEQNTP